MNKYYVITTDSLIGTMIIFKFIIRGVKMDLSILVMPLIHLRILR
jgi:hypothetical protein